MSAGDTRIMDLSKAFDGVSHRFLMDILNKLGEKQSYNWLTTYISDRVEFIIATSKIINIINQKLSKSKVIKC